MGNPKINMREFVQVYILLALDFVQRESNLPVESLEENIDAELHKLFDVCEKDMIYLRHPLHWTFFCNKKSPLEYVPSSSLKDPAPRVRIKREIDCEDKSKLVGYFFDNYENYFHERFKNVFGIRD